MAGRGDFPDAPGSATFVLTGPYRIVRVQHAGGTGELRGGAHGDLGNGG